MVKKQQQLGGLVTSLFSSGGGGSQEVMPCPSTSSSSSWQWPSCGQPRTLSLRQEQKQQQQTMLKQQACYKTMNSAYSVDCFSNSFASVDDSFSTASEANSGGGPVDASSENEAVEAVIVSALRSDRLFFEPADASSSSSIMMKQAASKKPKLMEDDDLQLNNKKDAVAFDGATAMSVESQNPYRDFRESMEAMVMSQGGGVKDWRWLEEMLGWYLRANGKSTNGLIVGAFVDLLVSLSNTSLGSSSFPATPTNCSSDDDCDECSSSSL